MKVRKFNEVVDKGDKDDVKRNKGNKIESHDKIDVERIKLLKETLDANVLKKVEMEEPKTIDSTEVKKSKEREKIVTAFDVLMESKNGGKITSITPKRKKRRLIGSKTPTSSSKNSLMEWLKKN